MKIKTNYEAQFQKNSLLNYEIRKKINLKKHNTKLLRLRLFAWKVVFFGK
jgi:hypothetical protein